MIQATELRIGNYLTYHTPDDTDMPCKIDAQDILNISTNYMHNAEIHSPIPLTEEILLKCGFEKEPISYSINIDSFGGGKRLSFSGDYLYITDSEKQNTIPTDIITLWNKDLRKEFYLHELQNIFHAITGTELNITL